MSATCVGWLAAAWCLIMEMQFQRLVQTDLQQSSHLAHCNCNCSWLLLILCVSLKNKHTNLSCLLTKSHVAPYNPPQSQIISMWLMLALTKIQRTQSAFSPVYSRWLVATTCNYLIVHFVSFQFEILIEKRKPPRLYEWIKSIEYIGIDKSESSRPTDHVFTINQILFTVTTWFCLHWNGF